MSVAAREKSPAGARLFDLFMGLFEIAMWPGARSRLLGRARGQVLEVACGTGLNVSHYPPGVRLVLTDIEGALLDRARVRAVAAGLDVQARVADASALPFPDRSFDTVVATLAMCGVPDPIGALAEMARVCREDGQILLLDHVRSHHALIALPQDWMTAITRRISGEHFNRDTLQLARAAGLGVVSTRSWRLGIMREVVLSPLGAHGPATPVDCPG